MSKILIDALDKFVPLKSYTARSQDQPWATAHTRLLLRKKNRNYKIFRDANFSYESARANPDSTEQDLTRLLNNRANKFRKARSSANDSVKANRRAKNDYFNSVNSTLRNPQLTGKKKFYFAQINIH